MKPDCKTCEYCDVVWSNPKQEEVSRNNCKICKDMRVFNNEIARLKNEVFNLRMELSPKPQRKPIKPLLKETDFNAQVDLHSLAVGLSYPKGE